MRRHDLAPSPITRDTGPGYSFFGRLVDFEGNCTRCSIIFDFVLPFARIFREHVEPANVLVECSSPLHSRMSFPTGVSFQFTDMPEMSSVTIQISDSPRKFSL